MLGRIITIIGSSCIIRIATMIGWRRGLFDQPQTAEQVRDSEHDQQRNQAADHEKQSQKQGICGRPFHEVTIQSVEMKRMNSPVDEQARPAPYCETFYKV